MKLNDHEENVYKTIYDVIALSSLDLKLYVIKGFEPVVWTNVS